VPSRGHVVTSVWMSFRCRLVVYDYLGIEISPLVIFIILHVIVDECMFASLTCEVVDTNIASTVQVDNPTRIVGVRAPETP
jgi:hypothetical protein